MICPYCSKKMEKGIIEAKSRVVWTTRQKLTVFKRKDEIPLSDLMELEYAAAYYCEYCNKIIVDLDEKLKSHEIG